MNTQAFDKHVNQWQSERIAELQADLAAAQAIIVDAGQQVADLKAENAQLRQALIDINSRTREQEPAFRSDYPYEWIVWSIGKITRKALQPKEDKQS